MIRKYVSCLTIAVVCSLAIFLAGCSSDTNLYNHANADDAFIAQLDLTSIISNTGSAVTSKGIELSPSLQKLVPYLTSGKERQQLDQLLAIKGIDLSKIVLSVNEHMEATVTFKVTNQQDLVQYLQSITYNDLKISEEKGYTIYTVDDDCTIFVYDNVGCMLLANRSVDTSDMETLKQNAQDNPVLPWQKDALQAGTTFNMVLNLAKYASLCEKSPSLRGFSLKALQVGYDAEQLAHAYTKLSASLQGLELNGKVSIVDSQNAPIISKFADQKIDTSLLKYASSNDMFVAMGAVPGAVNWSEILNQTIIEIGGYRQFGLDRETVNTIGEVLNDINGTAMLAAGPKNLLKMQSAEGWDVVLAAQMKPDMANKYKNQIKAIIDATNESYADLASQYSAIGYHGYKPKTVTYTDEADGMKIMIPNAGTVYVKTTGDTFLASLDSITPIGNCPILESEFEGMCGGTIVRLPRQNALSAILPLPFGIDFSYLSNGQEATFTFKETDTEGLLIENITKFIAGQSR